MRLFHITETELLRLVRYLYGITDSGDYLGVTFDKYLRHDLGIRTFETDTYFYLKDDEVDLNGIAGSYVDDCIIGGNE